MKGFKDFLSAKSISEDQYKEKSAEEMAGLYNEYNEKTREELVAAVKADTTELVSTLKSELQTNIVEQQKALNDTMKEYGISIKKLTEAERELAATGTATMLDSLKDNRDKLIAIKAGSNDRISLKVAGTMLLSTNVSGGNVPVEQRLPGFDDLPTREVRLLDIVSRGTAEGNIISWVSKANRDGSAAGTAEGALKNQIDFDLVVGSETVKKFTAFIKVSDEMVDDVPFMQSEINKELVNELLLLVESQVYEGDNTALQLNGILTQATAFVATTAPVAVDNANVVDVLRTAAAQIKKANQSAPTYHLLNCTDVLGIKLTKRSTTDKAYIEALQEIGGRLMLDGVPILETNLVTVGTYLTGDFNKATVFDKGAITVEVGRDSDDFVKNLVTVRAEWRGANVIRTNQTSAFVTGVIATDIAALEAIV